MNISIQFLFIALLIIINGYFVAAEFALVSIRRTRVEELVKKGNLSAKLVSKALSDLDTFISSTQLGITVASLALGWIGEATIAKLLESNLTFLPENIAFVSSHVVITLLSLAVITFLHVVLGELAPKTIALQKAEKVALFIIAPLTLFTRIFLPFIWILNGTGNLVVRLLGFKQTPHISLHSEEEIKMILSQSAKGGKIERQESEMAKKVFSFRNITLKQIMSPKHLVLAFSENSLLPDVARRLSSRIHSRFPVYKTTVEKITGFIHVKDVYKAALSKNTKTLKRAHVVREILRFSESEKADDVLFVMKKRQIHIGVVENKKGKTAGIITMEDIVERLVGDIHDEFE